MNRAVVSRFAAFRRVFTQKRTASGGHHEIVNPGPPVTLDWMPVPFQPYQQVHGELQSKFNVFLAVSVVLAVASFSYAIASDIFAFEQTVRPPKFYRNRQ